MMVSILMLFYTLPHLVGFRDPVMFSSESFCKVWTVLWGATSKSTVVLVAVLGVCRTIALLDPFNMSFRAIKKRMVLVALLSYFGMLVVCETVPMWYGYQYFFDQLRMKCEWRDLTGCDGSCVRVRTFGYIWSSVTLALPVLPMLGSAVLSIYALRKDGGWKESVKRQGSITISLFTVLYVTLNFPTLVYWLIFLTSYSRGNWDTSLYNFDHPYYFFFNFSEVLCVGLNSLLNPILYLVRMKKLREHISQQFYKGISSFRSATVGPSTTSTNLNNGPHFRGGGDRVIQQPAVVRGMVVVGHT